MPQLRGCGVPWGESPGPGQPPGIYTTDLAPSSYRSFITYSYSVARGKLALSAHKRLVTECFCVSRVRATRYHSILVTVEPLRSFVPLAAAELETRGLFWIVVFEIYSIARSILDYSEVHSVLSVDAYIFDEISFSFFLFFFLQYYVEIN